MAYTVIRTDLMSGTKQPADLVSLRFYGADANVAEVENGVIVELCMMFIVATDLDLDAKRCSICGVLLFVLTSGHGQ